MAEYETVRRAGACVRTAQIDEGLRAHMNKVYGLMIRSDALMRIRQARLTHLGMPQDSSYGTRHHIDEELAYSRRIFREHPDWPVIDVTSKAIEETAADILRIYNERANA